MKLAVFTPSPPVRGAGLFKRALRKLDGSFLATLAVPTPIAAAYSGTFCITR